MDPQYDQQYRQYPTMGWGYCAATPLPANELVWPLMWGQATMHIGMTAETCGVQPLITKAAVDAAQDSVLYWRRRLAAKRRARARRAALEEQQQVLTRAHRRQAGVDLAGSSR